MESKKIIGAILAIGILGAVIWFLFFRRGRTGQPIIALTPSEPQTTQQSSKVVYVSGNTSTSTFPLRQGSRGNEVKLLQEALNKAGFDVGTADGVWGNKTQTAFQKAFPNKLGINDLKDLEEVLAKLNQSKTTAPNQSTQMTEPVYNPNYAGRYAIIHKNPIKLSWKDESIFDYLQVGDQPIKLTGKWIRDSKGNIWVEYERPYNRGLAWTMSYYLRKIG